MKNCLISQILDNFSKNPLFLEKYLLSIIKKDRLLNLKYRFEKQPVLFTYSNKIELVSVNIYIVCSGINVLGFGTIPPISRS